MKRDGFRRYLEDRRLSRDEIGRSIAIAERFEAFLREPGLPGFLKKARSKDLTAFVARLMSEGTNTFENILALARYLRFGGNHATYVTALELVDGAEVFENLYAKLGEELGEVVRDEIFQGVPLPPLGTPTTERPRLTETVIRRLEKKVGAERARRVLGTGLRTLPDEGYLEEKRKFEEEGSVDAYLARKRRDFLALLEELKRDGKPFFAQMITDEVTDYVRSHPEVQQGVRDGNVVYEAKIPFMAAEYLAESDPKMKAYYYCHCPWVRESLRAGAARVPPVFCNCSAAFHKKPWEVIFGRPLEAEVLETVLQGDPWCRFAIHLPEDAV